MPQISMKLENIKRSDKYKKIKDYLDEYLKENGIDTPIFQDKVETYLQLWINKFVVSQEMKNINIDIENGAGNTAKLVGISTEMSRISTQMNKILLELGIDYKTLIKQVEDDVL